MVGVKEDGNVQFSAVIDEVGCAKRIVHGPGLYSEGNI